MRDIAPGKDVFDTCADVDESSKTEIKTTLLQYDRTLLVSDPRRCEPKKCVPASEGCDCPVLSASR